MAGGHLGLEQYRVVRGGLLLQSRNPFRRLGEQHPGVVERGQGEDRRIRLRVDVLVRRVGLHVLVDLRVVQRVTPLVPLDHREGQRRIEDRVQRVDERHRRQDPVEQLGREVRDRTHQQSAGGPALGDHLLRCRPPGVDEMPSRGHEVGEGVPLAEFLAVLVPVATHLPTTADVRQDEHHAAIEHRQSRHREVRVDTRLVGAVAVEEQGRRLGGVGFLAPHHRQRDPGAVLGNGPLPRLHVVGRVVTAEHRLPLEQGPLAGGDVELEQFRRFDETAISDAEPRGTPFRVGAEARGAEFLVEGHLAEIRFDRDAVDLPQIGDRETRQRISAVGQDQVVGEGVEVLDPALRVVRDQRTTVRRVGDRREVDGEVLRLLPVADFVVHDDQIVLAADDGVLDAVLDPVDPRCDAAEFTRRIVGGEQVALRGDLGPDADDEVLVAPGGAHPDPEPLVGLVKDLDVGRPGTDVVTPHRVRAPGGVDRRVEHVPGVRRPHRTPRGVANLVGEELPGAKVLDAQGVSLVPDDVDAVGEPVAVVADGQRPETEEIVTLRLDVGVEQDLLAGQRVVAHLWRGPVVLGPDRAAARRRVLLALMGSPVIPVPPAPVGHRHVGFLGAALDLAEDLRAQVRQLRGVRFGEGVLRLQVGDDLRIVLVAQPFVVVDEGVAVVGAFGGHLLGHRRGDRRCVHDGLLVGHQITSASGQSAKDFREIHS